MRNWSAETGLTASYRQYGRVTVARTEDRMTQFAPAPPPMRRYDLDHELLRSRRGL